jgi:hypothetical protein
MPIPTIAGEPRGFDAEDSANFTGTHLANQPLESGTFHQARAGTAQIVIDHHNLSKTKFASSIGQAVLSKLALLVVEDLTG